MQCKAHMRLTMPLTHIQHCLPSMDKVLSTSNAIKITSYKNQSGRNYTFSIPLLHAHSLWWCEGWQVYPVYHNKNDAHV